MCDCFLDALASLVLTPSTRVSKKCLEHDTILSIERINEERHMKAIRIHNTGGPEVLTHDEVELPQPGPGEARVKLAASGVNFIDTYQRKGLYPLKLPIILGQEGGGVVDAVGEGVTEVKPGDKVVYTSIMGSYAEYVIAPAGRLIPVPEGVP